MKSATLDPDAAAERVIRIYYPSIASNPVGRLIGTLMECIPIPIGSARVSNLIFGLPLAPIGALLYVLLKAFGERYAVTDRAVRRESALTGSPNGAMPLESVDQIDLRLRHCYRFFRAGDLILRSNDDRATLKLIAVPYAEAVRQTILEACEARKQTDAAIKQIERRKG
ncbi:PH domain-containing protein [Stratiformator vulcanicus]|nr:PH domain-containing protein [Stratiformator vulcanicus]